MKIFSFINSRLIIRIKQLIWQPKKFVYVAIGDSTVEGIGASHSSKSFPSLVFEKIKKDKEEAVFHNLGKGGAKVRDVIDSQLPKTIELKPNLITISVGGNDLHRRTKLKHFEKDYFYLIKTLKEKTDARIIISNIPDVSLLPSLSIFVRYLAKFMTRRLNRVIDKHAKQFRCILIDLHGGSKTHSKKHAGLISGDGFHPSDKGYSLWANAIIAYL
ncbi:MAG: SGNH/GDSL hydrolase family protein [Patescibacteria group bacterium]